MDAAASITLICWGHTFIPTLAGLLACAHLADIPERWPDDRFDVVWAFAPEPPDGGYSFRQLPQLLLFEDSEAPIS